MNNVRNTEDGRDIWYVDKQVIAVGEAARTFVLERPGNEEAEWELLFETADPPLYLIRNVFDSLEVVAAARANNPQHHVQLDHALPTHSGPDDWCCDGWPDTSSQPDGTVPQADPTKANGTTAVDIPSDGLSLPGEPGPSGTPAQIWILDTGLAAEEGDGEPADNATVSDPTDVLDAYDPSDPTDQGEDLVDPAAGHGTFIAGIIRRLQPDCTILVKDVMDAGGYVYQSKVVTLLNALREHADQWTIVNLSFGGNLDDPGMDVLGDKIKELQDDGVVVVSSAGNKGSCQRQYPAAFDDVVAVGAVNRVGFPAPFTNRGSWVTANALGVNIASTFLLAPSGAPSDVERFDSGWAKWSGTSFAAPIVTAAIALKINTGLSAMDAKAQVLAQGPQLPCLGVHVNADGRAAALAYP
jgi:hypothetical protein